MAEPVDFSINGVQRRRLSLIVNDLVASYSSAPFFALFDDARIALVQYFSAAGVLGDASHNIPYYVRVFLFALARRFDHGGDDAASLNFDFRRLAVRALTKRDITDQLVAEIERGDFNLSFLVKFDARFASARHSSKNDARRHRLWLVLRRRFALADLVEHSNQRLYSKPPYVNAPQA